MLCVCADIDNAFKANRIHSRTRFICCTSNWTKCICSISSTVNMSMRDYLNNFGLSLILLRKRLRRERRKERGRKSELNSCQQSQTFNTFLSLLASTMFPFLLKCLRNRFRIPFAPVVELVQRKCCSEQTCFKAPFYISWLHKCFMIKIQQTIFEGKKRETNPLLTEIATHLNDRRHQKRVTHTYESCHLFPAGVALDRWKYDFANGFIWGHN